MSFKPARVESLQGTPEDWYLVGTTNDFGVTFENSWANVGGATDPPASFFKDKMGIVHLRGRIDSGSSGTTAFTLPVGYRPEYLTSQLVYNDNGGPGPGGASVRVFVYPDGSVDPTFTAGTDMWLDGVSFRAA